MTVEYAVEKLSALEAEIKNLLPLHWAELAVYEDIPLDPEYDFYTKADALDLLTFFTVRDDKRLVGYAIFIVQIHKHYKSHRWAMNDIIWLHPSYRGHSIGKRLVDFWDAYFAGVGVSVVHVNSKIAHPHLADLLKFCGYASVEVGLEKRVG
jgi:GNAT superfamily N-acetyltransferase